MLFSPVLTQNLLKYSLLTQWPSKIARTSLPSLIFPDIWLTLSLLPKNGCKIKRNASIFILITKYICTYVECYEIKCIYEIWCKQPWMLSILQLLPNSATNKLFSVFSQKLCWSKLLGLAKKPEKVKWCKNMMICKWYDDILKESK